MHATLAPPGQQEMCPWYDLVDSAPDAPFAMPDALDVIRTCHRVIVWRRQTLIDENRKASRELEFRSQASGRAPFALFLLRRTRPHPDDWQPARFRDARDDQNSAVRCTRAWIARHNRRELILLRHIDQVLSRLNGTLHEESPSFSSCAGHPGGARDHERTMNHVY